MVRGISTATLLGLVLAASAAAQTTPAPNTDPTVLPKEVEWKPVTGEERWKAYNRRAFASPGAWLRPLIPAAFDQWNDRPPSWPQGMEGYGRRLGQRYATFTMQDTFEAGLSAAAKYDPRYVRCKCEGTGKRVWHAMQLNFVTYNNDGKKVFNWPKFAGIYGAGMLATTWVHDYKWSAQGARSGNLQFGFGMAMNVLREFTPELRRALKRK